MAATNDRAETDKKILAGALVALLVAFMAGTRAGVLPKAETP